MQMPTKAKESSYVLQLRLRTKTIELAREKLTMGALVAIEKRWNHRDLGMVVGMPLTKLSLGLVTVLTAAERLETWHFTMVTPLC